MITEVNNNTNNNNNVKLTPAHGFLPLKEHKKIAQLMHEQGLAKMSSCVTSNNTESTKPVATYTRLKCSPTNRPPSASGFLPLAEQIKLAEEALKTT